MNPHTYPTVEFIYINADVYVSYLQAESQNEEGEQRLCWLMEYSWMALRGQRGKWRGRQSKKRERCGAVLLSLDCIVHSMFPFRPGSWISQRIEMLGCVRYLIFLSPCAQVSVLDICEIIILQPVIILGEDNDHFQKMLTSHGLWLSVNYLQYEKCWNPMNRGPLSHFKVCPIKVIASRASF